VSAAALRPEEVERLAGGACGITRAYFLTYGGGCRRMAVQQDHAGTWRYSEFPYEPGRPCLEPGPHPHRGYGSRHGGKILRP